MKVAIVIMGADNDLARRNTSAQIEWLSKLISSNSLKHEYKILNYFGAYGNRLHHSDLYTYTPREVNGVEVGYLLTMCGDGINRTYEKTVCAFNFLLNNKDVFFKGDFDYVVRMNISAVLNVVALDTVLEELDKDCVYAARFNSAVSSKYNGVIYPRGDFYIMHRDVLLRASEHFYSVMEEPLIEHVDDVMMGLCLLRAYGKEPSLKHYHAVRYQFLPDFKIGEKFAPWNNVLYYRVKTIPPNEKHSGYSWEDNEWRRMDTEKINRICKVLYEFPPKDISVADVIAPDSETFIVFFNLNDVNLSLEELKKQLLG